MEIIDKFFDFIGAAYGKQPDGLKTLEKQTLAVAVVAATNKFAPKLAQGAVINTLTRSAALYVNRHPFATIASFWFAAMRNAGLRPQWAGPYTREIETAIGIPVFAQLPRILTVAGHALALPFRPEYAQGIIRTADWIGRIKAPKVTSNWLNNSATRGVVNYVVAHPAAFLGAYFTAQYIDKTYRPQWLGPYSQEIITAGLVPLYAHGQNLIPPSIRAAGSTVKHVTSATAYVYDKSLDLLNRPWRDSRGRFVSEGLRRPIAGFALGAVAEYIQHRERREAEIEGRPVAWWAAYPGTGFLAAGSLTGLSYLQKPFSNNYGFGKFLWQPRVWVSGLGSGIGSVASRLYYGKFPALVPWAARRLWAASWLTTFWANPAFIWALSTGQPAYIKYPIYGVFALSKFGFVAPLFIKPSLAEGVNLWVNGIRGLPFRIAWSAQSVWKNLGVAASSLGLPRLAALAGRTAPVLRAIGVGARATAVGAAGLGGVVLRGATGPTATIGLLGVELVNEEARIVGMMGDENEIRGRIQARLNMLQRMEDDGYVFPRPIAVIKEEINSPFPWLSHDIYMRRLLNRLDFVLAYEGTARLPSLPPEFFAGVKAFETAFAVGAGVLERFSQQSQTQQQQARARPGIPGEVARDAWRRQVRDAQGRWFRAQVPYVAPLPPVRINFDSALAYINRRAAEATRVKVHSDSAARPDWSVSNAAIPTVGPGRQNWLFKGEDRRMMEQTLRDLLAIQSRDVLAASGKMTTALSNRDPIIDPQSWELTNAVEWLIYSLRYNLSLVRGQGERSVA